MKIVIGCDEAAYELKQTFIKHLQAKGHEITDVGCGADETVMYPDIAAEACKYVVSGTCQRGILLCGTGTGMAMAANKVPGIRAAVCHDPFSTQRSILSNDAQVFCLGARIIAPHLALCLLDTWMDLEYVDGPSTPKIERITYHEQHPYRP